MKEMIKRLMSAFMAFRDPELVEIKDELTGVLSRKVFARVANRELARAQRKNQPFSLLFIDLDGLKRVNDEKGHKAGDLFLKTFAQFTLAHIRPYDILCRWGGDEFILLLPATLSVDAERIIGRIHDSFPHFSWGISSWFKGVDLEGLLEEADAEMYRMKK